MNECKGCSQWDRVDTQMVHVFCLLRKKWVSIWDTCKEWTKGTVEVDE